MEANTERDLRAGRERGGESAAIERIFERDLHLHRRADRLLRRTVEESEDAIAEIVNDEAFVLANARGDMGEIAVDEGEDFLRFELLADGREVAQVGEHDRGAGTGASTERRIER